MSSERTRSQFYGAELGDTPEFLPTGEGKASGENGGSIRLAQCSDFEQIVHMEQMCFPGPLAYSRNQMEYLLFQANGECFVDSVNGEIRGMVILLFRNGSKVAGIETIAVDPKYQGRGIGAKLLKAAEDEMLARGIRKSQLEVAMGNMSATRLYSKAGYEVVKVLPDYYRYRLCGSRDALRMRKDLQN